MADDKSFAVGRSPRINVNAPYEVASCTKALGRSKSDLRAAVKAVGVIADDVRARLKK